MEPGWWAMSVSDQTRLVVARYGLLLAVVAALLSAVALGGAISTYLNPPEEQVTEQTHEQFVAASVETAATVTNETPLYEEGQVLENMPVYFFQATPNVTFHVRATVPNDQEVSVTQRLVLLLRATRDGQTFYRTRRIVAAARSQVSDGVLWSNATMNMSATRTFVTEKRNAIGGVGTLSVTLELNTSYESNRYSGVLSATSPVVFAETAYWFGNDLTASRTHSRTETRLVTRSPNMTTVGGLAILGIVLLTVAGMVYLRYREIDPRSIETELARSRYDEWISRGEIPTKSEKEYIGTDSLEDLVDVAIDSNGRVIYDRSLDAYAVIQGDLVYYFTTDQTEVTDWLDI